MPGAGECGADTEMGRPCPTLRGLRMTAAVWRFLKVFLEGKPQAAGKLRGLRAWRGRGGKGYGVEGGKAGEKENENKVKERERIENGERQREREERRGRNSKRELVSVILYV